MPPDSEIAAMTDTIYDAAVGDASWQDVARQLDRRFHGAAAIFVQTDRPVEALAMCVNADECRARSYLERYWMEDEAMRRIRTTRSSDVLVDAQLVSPETRRRSGFYSEYLVEVGCGVGFYAPVLREADSTFIVSVRRSPRRGEYDADELQLVRTLQPHFRRALRTYGELRRLRLAEAATQAALSNTAVGVIFVDAQGRPRFVSQLAEQQMARGGLTVTAGVLRAAIYSAGRALQTAIAAAAAVSGGVASTVELPAGEGRRPLQASVSPARRGVAALSDEPLAMILLRRDDAPVFDAQAAARLYGLTPAEARLLDALVAGRRLGEFAAASGVRVTTMKTHLERLFDKFEVGRQADLIRAALSDVRLR